MPAVLDPYRFNGPAVSAKPLKLGAGDAHESTAGARKDGRGLKDVRAVSVKAGVLAHAAGSAFLECGQTKIICAVYGPRTMAGAGLGGPGAAIMRSGASGTEAAMPGILRCSMQKAPFADASRHETLGTRAREQELSRILQLALAPAVRLDAIPKSVVDVHVTVLETDGDLAALASGITAASVALVDAGIDVYDSVVAACGVLVPSRDSVPDGVASKRKAPLVLLVDPSGDEERAAGASQGVMVAAMPRRKEATHLQETGKADCEAVTSAFGELLGPVVSAVYAAVEPALGEVCERGMSG